MRLVFLGESILFTLVLLPSSKAARFLCLEMQPQTQPGHSRAKVVINGSIFTMNSLQDQTPRGLSSWSLRSVCFFVSGTQQGLLETLCARHDVSVCSQKAKEPCGFFPWPIPPFLLL